MKTFILLLALAVTASAQLDYQAIAVKNYPDLGKAGSKMHTDFLRAIADAKEYTPAVLKRADWPLVLARRVAPVAQPFAGLGLTEAQIRNLYGTPDDRPLLKIVPPSTKTLSFDKMDYSALFRFWNGKCVSVHFFRQEKHKFSEQDIEDARKANQGKFTWESSGGGGVWKRSDGGVGLFTDTTMWAIDGTFNAEAKKLGEASR